MIEEIELLEAERFAVKMIVQALVLAAVFAALLSTRVSLFSDLNILSGLVLVFFLYKGFKTALRWVHTEEWLKHKKTIDSYIRENSDT